MLKHDPVLAKTLEAQLKLMAESSEHGDGFSAADCWMRAMQNAVRFEQPRDFAVARALVGELAEGAKHLSGPHARFERVKDANNRIMVRKLKDLILPIDAIAAPDDLRVKMLDATQASGLERLGRNLFANTALLSNTAITAIPEDAKITRLLDVSQCRHLARMPPGMILEDLQARDCTALETLPQGMLVSKLDLTGCSALTALPDDLVVFKSLTLRGCSKLTRLPDMQGWVANELDLVDCANITALPDGFYVSSWIDIAGSGITSLPPSFAGKIRWRGVQIDERIAFRPETITEAEIRAERNNARRRVMKERLYGRPQTRPT